MAWDMNNLIPFRFTLFKLASSWADSPMVVPFHADDHKFGHWQPERRKVPVDEPTNKLAQVCHRLTFLGRLHIEALTLSAMFIEQTAVEGPGRNFFLPSGLSSSWITFEAQRLAGKSINIVCTFSHLLWTNIFSLNPQTNETSDSQGFKESNLLLRPRLRLHRSVRLY